MKIFILVIIAAATFIYTTTSTNLKNFEHALDYVGYFLLINLGSYSVLIIILSNYLP